MEGAETVVEDEVVPSGGWRVACDVGVTGTGGFEFEVEGVRRGGGWQVCCCSSKGW